MKYGKWREVLSLVTHSIVPLRETRNWRSKDGGSQKHNTALTEMGMW